MFGHIFYFLGLIILFFNLIYLSNITKITKINEWFITFKKVSGRYPTKNDFEADGLNYYLYSNAVLGITFFWLFLGLISQAWLVCLLLILLKFSVNSLIGLLGFNALSRFLEKMKIFLTCSSIAILVFNHFHFGLNVTQVLLGH